MPASSKAQQRFMGLVRAVQKGEVPKNKVSKAIKKVAKDMKAKEVDKYASTKHKNLPDKVDELVPNMAVINQPAYKKMLDKQISKNTKIKTALSNKDHKDHKKAKSIMQRIKDKLMKKKPIRLKSKSGMGKISHLGIESVDEKINLFLEKNVPTNPSKWSYYKSQAKKKFDVYPSAYANAWAAKQYKAAGGGWKKESVELEEGQINEATYVKGKMNSIFKFSGKQLVDGLVGNVVDSPSVERNRIKAQASKKAKAQILATYLKFKKDIEKIVKPFDSEITGR